MGINSKGNCEYCDRYVCNCVITDDDEDDLELKNFRAQILKIKFALKSFYTDNHNWSSRGCQTCKQISEAIGEGFGCVLAAKDPRYNQALRAKRTIS
jgi:hypothetical protein